ncbi:MAG: type II toxin-antitoxin system HicB family antitoxin [Thermoanaerobaculia bacterium]
MQAEAIATEATINTFTVVFEEAEKGGYCVFVEELPGAISQGETIEEARENIKEAIQLILEVNRERALEGVDNSRVIREQIVIQR